MYEKYPISGIKQSYRHTREVPTVVMPVLIGLLLLAMVTFFFQSKPEEVPTPQEVASTQEEADRSLREPAAEARATRTPALPANPAKEPSRPAEAEADPETPPSDATEEEGQTVSAPSRSLVKPDAEPGRGAGAEPGGRFTAWMTPLALDTYIRLKNKGYSESFWQRGHWITAVEGRWAENTHEFRIALDKIPDRNRWQWQYRVNQSAEEFATAAREYADQGYLLIHSQSFVEPGGEPRFQAVWQRQLAESDPVVETSTPTSSSSVSDPSRPLDVNNLRFR